MESEEPEMAPFHNHCLPKIAYLCQSFPSLTETFIYREVLALRKKGWDIKTLSVWKPSMTIVSEEARFLIDETFYVFPLNLIRFIMAHIYYLFVSPLKYFGVLLFVLTQPDETMKKRMRTLVHFGEAIYLAYSLRKWEIQHIHAHFAFNAASIAMMISKLTGRSFSVTVHAHDIFSRERLLVPAKLRSAKFIISISRYNRDVMKSMEPNAGVEEKTYIVHCGLEPESFSPEHKIRQGDGSVILSIGRMIEKKGFTYLIKACEILARQGYKFKCQIIGDGPQKALIEKMIQENGLEEKVSLEGVVFQENIKKYLCQADLFVLPCVVARNGDQDGIPVVLMEAMAMKVPVVSTMVSGIPELVQHGKDGLLVPQRDELALAEAMALLIKDNRLRKELSENGRKRIETEFNIAKIADQLSKIFTRELFHIDNS